ncbi:sugar transferase [Morganella morganii]|uniref:sugar transferase n=1 Tax=Morganella morganii TaxID=582 RepID=UPI001BD6A587|nr:sugar transferase [Morganella morganii subsp. morganii]
MTLRCLLNPWRFTRPESLELSNWYEKEVHFFAYRHIIRPSITGWAQLTQGYAAEVDGMNLKLQYDFYYIKHFSFWLDVLAVLKTIRTIVTGNIGSNTAR